MNRRFAILYILAALLCSVPSIAQTCGVSPAPQSSEHIYLQQLKVLSANIFGLAVNPSDSCALYNPCSVGARDSLGLASGGWHPDLARDLPGSLQRLPLPRQRDAGEADGLAAELSGSWCHSVSA